MQRSRISIEVSLLLRVNAWTQIPITSLSVEAEALPKIFVNPRETKIPRVILTLNSWISHVISVLNCLSLSSSTVITVKVTHSIDMPDFVGFLEKGYIVIWQSFYLRAPFSTFLSPSHLLCYEEHASIFLSLRQSTPSGWDRGKHLWVFTNSQALIKIQYSSQQEFFLRGLKCYRLR